MPKLIDITYTGTDAEDDAVSLLVEWSPSGLFTGEEQVATPATDPANDGITGLAFTSGGTGFQFVWDAETDLGSAFAGTAHVRLTPSDTHFAGVAQTVSINLNFRPAVDATEGSLQNISSETISVIANDKREARYFSKSFAPNESFAVPGFVLRSRFVLNSVSQGKLRILESAVSARKITGVEVESYCPAGKVTLTAGTATQVTATSLTSGDIICLTAANAAAAGLADVYVDPASIAPGTFTIQHATAAGTEEFNWFAIQQQ